MRFSRVGSAAAGGSRCSRISAAGPSLPIPGPTGSACWPTSTWRSRPLPLPSSRSLAPRPRGARPGATGSCPSLSRSARTAASRRRPVPGWAWTCSWRRWSSIASDDDADVTSADGPRLAGRHLELRPGAATFFGAGEVARLPACVAAAGRRRAFVVTDAGVVASGVVADVARALGGAGIEHELHDSVRPNPDTGALEAGAGALRRFGEAVVIGLGGGAVLDAAKGISLAATNQVDVHDLDYRRDNLLPGLPVIAVPTTAGTGAETNGFRVMDHPRGERQASCGRHH